MIDTAELEQFCLIKLYDAIPVRWNPSDWSQWNNRVWDFIRKSPVAEDGAIPPDKDQAKEWYSRQRFYTAMITEKLSYNAAPQHSGQQSSALSPATRRKDGHSSELPAKLRHDLFGYPVRIKRSLAFRIALRRTTNRPLKLPGPNWPRALKNAMQNRERDE
jgi:hypothetical protein